MNFLFDFPHFDGGIDLHHIHGVDLEADLHHAMQHIFEGFSSNGEVAVGKITEAQRADLLKQYHKAYELLGRKLDLNKHITAQIMLPLFAVSLMTPTWIHEALTPVFVFLGLHLGTEGAKRYDKIINKVSDRVQHFAEDHHFLGAHASDVQTNPARPVPISAEQALKNMKFMMRLTAVEVASAGIGSIYHQTMIEQLMTMAAYYVMTTYGTWGLSRFMIGLHQVGVSLMTSDYDNATRRDKAKHQFGYRLTKMADKIYRNSASLSAFAKLLTSGRVLNHALLIIPHLVAFGGYMAEKWPEVGAVIKHVPGIDGWLPEKLAIGTVWLGVGLMAGSVGLLAHKLLYPTIEKHVVSKVQAQWTAAAERLEKNRHVQAAQKMMSAWDNNKDIFYNRTINIMHSLNPWFTSGPLTTFGLGALQVGMHLVPAGTTRRAKQMLARPFDLT